MLITDKKELWKYGTEWRIWQGIPGIEITKKGRLFMCFYSGGTTEQIGNFTALIKSDDGVNFSEPIVVVYEEGYRAYDSTIWIDPLERLWLIWSTMPENTVYAAVCEKPDDEELVWGEEFIIGHDVMLNKPTVLSTGEWLFPIAVWNHGVRVLPPEYDSKNDKGSFVYKSADKGKSFEKIGAADIFDRSYDEHMILELIDGRLMMLVRTNYGIGISYSADGGNTWINAAEDKIEGPCTRFHIRRLPSGRILLVYHPNKKERKNLTAYLSDDECKTWKYELLLDERNMVSYPDVAVGNDGYIYIAYDRERGSGRSSFAEVYEWARELLFAKITEEDIIKGKIVDSGSRLKCVVSKLEKYAGDEKGVFN